MPELAGILTFKRSVIDYGLASPCTATNSKQLWGRGDVSDNLYDCRDEGVDVEPLACIGSPDTVDIWTG